jgi:putative glutamine amidotransferase
MTNQHQRAPVIGLTAFTSTSQASENTPWSVSRSAVNQQYIDAVAHAGGAPILIPVGLDVPVLERIYAVLDGLLLPGGDDVAPHHYGQEPHPNIGLIDHDRDELELTLTTWALRDNLPILGICRGVQVLAVAAGGSLYQDVPSQVDEAHAHDVRLHGRDHLAHEMHIEPGSRLAQAVGRNHALVNTFHHQAILDMPDDFDVTARAPDGVIEAIEARGDQFVVGIQCHPEGIWQTTAPEFGGLFTAFVEAARSRSAAAV